MTVSKSKFVTAITFSLSSSNFLLKLLSSPIVHFPFGKYLSNIFIISSLWGPRVFNMKIDPPYPQRVVKGDLFGRFLGITV